jgi:16S rRNA (adenine1518-N6/adenine1519-N6)-dimethyltransferase
MSNDTWRTKQIVEETAVLRNRARAKRFGQHFLINPQILGRIVDASGPLQGRLVVEIGPGPGGLTREILRRQPAHLFVIEKDERFVESLSALDGVTVFNEDASDFNYSKLLEEKIYSCADRRGEISEDQPINIRELMHRAIEAGGILDLESRLLPDIPSLIRQLCPAPSREEPCSRLKIISNLPYNAGSAIYTNALKYVGLIEDMTLMFQKEVAERLLAKSKSRDYGSLSVITQYFTDACRVMRLAPGSFYPPPKVYSDVLYFKSRPDADPRLFNDLSAFCLELFQHKRKKLKNRLCEK